MAPPHDRLFFTKCQAFKQRGASCVYARLVAFVELEFMVEPFNEGAPGPHVLAAIAAAEAAGAAVEMGPFGSVATVSSGAVAELGRVIIDAALAAGARRISISVQRT